VGVVGGALFGLAIGYTAYRMLATVDHYQVEILITLALVTGGISVALALSLPGGPHRDAIIAVTYAVVVFSILVQGLTLSRVIKKRDARAQ
jgi:NhaP-type Na+/H+ or K+/H+ antiporter